MSDDVPTDISKLPMPEISGGSTVVVGNYGGGNLGDETMLDIIADRLVSTNSVSRIVVPTRRPDVLKKLHPQAAVKSTNMLVGIFQALFADTLILGGGTIFSTFSGPGIKLITLVAIVRKLLLKKKYFFYGIGYSSSTSKLLSLFAKKAFELADGIYVRDTLSLEILRKDLKVNSAIIMPELAFYLKRSAQVPRDFSDVLKTLDGPLIGLSLMYLPNVDPKIVSEPLKEFIRYLHSKYNAKFIFLTFQPRVIDYRGGWQSDQEVAEAIIRDLPEELRSKCHALPIYSPPATLAIVNKLDLVISMRYHCLVFAFTQNRPFISLAFEDKHRAFVRDYGGKKIELDEISADKLISSWESTARTLTQR